MSPIRKWGVRAGSMSDSGFLNPFFQVFVGYPFFNLCPLLSEFNEWFYKINLTLKTLTQQKYSYFYINPF